MKEVDDPPYAGYNNSLAVDPTNPRLVYCGEVRLLRSKNGGDTSWCALHYSENANYGEDAPMEFVDMRNSFPHSDIHAIVFDRSVSPPRVIVGDDGGVHGLVNDPQGFYWTNLNHGLNVTEFYHVTTQQELQSITAGGTQDNGPLVTYGNRTWFHGFPGDTKEIAIDAAYGCTLYGDLEEDDGPYQVNAWPCVIPGSDLRNKSLNPVTSVTVYPPIASSVTQRRNLLAYARPDGSPFALAQSVDSAEFNLVPKGALDSFVYPTALAPVEGNQGVVGWYAGYANDPSSGGSPQAGIQSCQDFIQGKPIVKKKLKGEIPNAIAVDPHQPLRAVVATGVKGKGKLWLTTDGGVRWSPTRLPISSPATGVTWDPVDPNMIWIATDVGVLCAHVSGPEMTSFETCMSGLPGPISVTDIHSSRAGTITIGTMGYGAYQIDRAPDAVTQDVALCIRDNIFDRGREFRPGPDPEHPVVDPSDSAYRVAAPGKAGLQFFNSTDIRVDVPSRCRPKNQVDVVDNVSFESTPIELPEAFPGTILDTIPAPGDRARVFVQVTNLGSKPAHRVRVFVMWCEAGVGQLFLPSDFWAKTLPGPSLPCGQLNSSFWHALPGLNGSNCDTLLEIRPEMPEVAGFEWVVPPNVNVAHIDLLAFVESAEDSLEPTLRAMTDLSDLVPQSRHLALRNLFPVSASAAMSHEVVNLTGNKPKMEDLMTNFQIRVERPWLDRATRVAVVLPRSAKHGALQGVHSEFRRNVDLPEAFGDSLFVIDTDSSTIAIVRVNQPDSMVVLYGSANHSRLGQRFIVRTERDGKVLGGATWVLRTKAGP